MLKRLIIDDILIGRIVRDIVQVIFRELLCKLASAPFKIKISDDAIPFSEPAHDSSGTATVHTMHPHLCRAIQNNRN